MLKSFKGSWCSCWLSRSSGKTLKFLLNSLWTYYGVSLPQIHIIWILLTFSWSNDICVCPTSLFFASREGYQLCHYYRYQKVSGRLRNDRNENRWYYFPKPTYGCSRLQPDSPADLVFSLWLQKTLSNFFHLCLLPCSLYPTGSNSKAVLNGLELIFHLDAPCQCRPIGTKTKKKPGCILCLQSALWTENFFFIVPRAGVFLFVWGWFFVCGFWLFGFRFGWFVGFVVGFAFHGKLKTFISISFPVD